MQFKQSHNWQDKYQKLQVIGAGSSGKIYKVLSKETKQIMAAKIINLEMQGCELQSVQQEIKIMTSCTHLNIIQCLGVSIFGAEVWILLEYCEGHSLTDIMKARKSPYNEEEISSIMKQVLEGLVYLHHKGVIHRDIKASNLLYHKGVVKIADFGISLINQGFNPTQSKFGRFGSPYWMSPEILSHSIYNQKTDIWALGITAIQLAEGQPPYSHQHPFRAIYSIQTHPPSGLTKPQSFSKQFANFVHRCLNTNYQSRPTAKVLVQHSFITGEPNTIQSSPGWNSGNESQNTIIMHEDLPKSIWQKPSYPQSCQKQGNLSYSVTDTVIVKQYSQQQDGKIFENLSYKDRKISNSDINFSAETREKQAKMLLNEMQEQIKSIRKHYMTRIKSLQQIKQSMEQSSQIAQIEEQIVNSQASIKTMLRYNSNVLNKALERLAKSEKN